MRRLFLAAIALLPGLSPAFAQRIERPSSRASSVRALRHLRHSSWTPETGMPLPRPNQLYQTPDGYLWYGSVDGPIVRFDGQRFVKIDSSLAPGMMRSSSDDAIPIGAERGGALWIARGDGALFRYERGAFKQMAAADSVRGAANHMTQDGANDIWITARRRIYRWRAGRFENAVLPGGAPTSGVVTVLADTGRGLWVSSATDGLWHVVGGRVDHFPLPAGYRGITIALAQTPTGRLFAATTGAILGFENGRWTGRITDSAGVVDAAAIAQSRTGEVWVGTLGKGVMRFSDGRAERFGKSDGLSDAHIRAITIDREDNVWVVTNTGLDEFSVEPFATLGALDHAPFDVPEEIVPDGADGVWVTSEQGHAAYHLRTDITERDTGTTTWTRPAGHLARSDFLLGPARGGGVWALGGDRGISRVRDDGVTAVIPRKLLNVVRAVHEDPDGALLISSFAYDTGFGIARWHNGTLTPIRLEPGKDPGSTSFLVPDGRGRVWTNNVAKPVIYAIAGDSVVARVDSTNGVTGVVVAMATRGDTLWMSTVKELLRVVNGKAVRVPFAGDARLFAPRFVDLAIVNDRLWISTSFAIASISLDSANAVADGRSHRLVPRTYSGTDGLANARAPLAQMKTAFSDNTGHLWLSTSTGVAVFDPNVSSTNRVPPSVAIEELIAGGKIFTTDAAIRIPSQPDRVELRYTAIGLRSPNRLRIEYKLDGADRSWNQGLPSRVAAYSQLRPGDYTFRVRAWNEDGVPSTKEASLAFTVLPAWYQAKWFVALVILVVVASGPLMVYYVLRGRARRREAELHARFDAMLAERTRVAGELHDTLLSGFTGVTLQLNAVQHMVRESPDVANRVSSMVSDAEQSLVDARHMIWDMRLPELHERDLPEALEEAARRCIGDAPIALAFVVSGTKRRLAPQLEATVLRVAREAVTNAVRHARPRLVEIELTYHPTRVCLDVCDDGSGFDPDALETAHANGHWGVRGMRERAERVGGSLTIGAAADGRGTTISLDLPSS